jgi:hypothetical protein
MLFIATLLGLGIAFVDSRPTWDDTGITAGAIALVSCVLAAVSPSRPWLVALSVGAWVPLFGLLTAANWGCLLALAFAFGGAYVGTALRSGGIAARA